MICHEQQPKRVGEKRGKRKSKRPFCLREFSNKARQLGRVSTWDLPPCTLSRSNPYLFALYSSPPQSSPNQTSTDASRQ